MEQVNSVEEYQMDEGSYQNDGGLAARAAEDINFYKEGKSDFIRNNLNTPAAIGYIAYWRTQDL